MFSNLAIEYSLAAKVYAFNRHMHRYIMGIDPMSPPDERRLCRAFASRLVCLASLIFMPIVYHLAFRLSTADGALTASPLGYTIPFTIYKRILSENMSGKFQLFSLTRHRGYRLWQERSPQ